MFAKPVCIRYVDIDAIILAYDVFIATLFVGYLTHGIELNIGF